MIRSHTYLKYIFTCLIVVVSSASHSLVVSGFEDNWNETIVKEFGDGENGVDINWFLPNLGGAADFSASLSGIDTSFSLAADVTDISQIVDASAFDFSDEVNSVCDAACDPYGNGDFVIAMNNATGFFSVIQVLDVYDLVVDDDGGLLTLRLMDANWWFQTDGTGNFSDVAAVPLPASVWFLFSGLLSLMGIRKLASKKRIDR